MYIHILIPVHLHTSIDIDKHVGLHENKYNIFINYTGISDATNIFLCQCLLLHNKWRP